jgi:exopolysaccharide production protein ExoQ
MSAATLTSTDAPATVWASTLPIWKVTLFVLLFLAAAINPVDFKTDPSMERVTKSVKGVVLLKLAIAGAVTACGFLGLFFGPSVRDVLRTLPAFGLLILCVIYIISSFFAPAEFRIISFGSALIYCGYLSFLATVVSHLGGRLSVIAIVSGTGVYLLATWFWYITQPELGRFLEPVPGGITVSRMGGMGHPNHVARNAICVAIVALGALLVPRPRGRSFGFALFLVLTIAFMIATVYMTISRTSMLAGFVAVSWMVMDRFWNRGGIALFTTLAALIAIAILAFTLVLGQGPISQSGLSAVTKSGDIEEITSFTGRTVIWEESVQWIIRRPLTGWGMDSAASLLSNNSQACHNLYLNTAFTGGFPALMVMLGLVAWTVRLGFWSSVGWIRGLVAFIMVSSIVEDTLMDMFPPALSLLWIVALLIDDPVDRFS